MLISVNKKKNLMTLATEKSIHTPIYVTHTLKKLARNIHNTKYYSDSQINELTELIEQYKYKKDKVNVEMIRKFMKSLVQKTTPAIEGWHPEAEEVVDLVTEEEGSIIVDLTVT